MRHSLFGLFVVLCISLLAGCGDDATGPGPARDGSTIQGQIGDTDFEFEIPGGEPGDPFFGPFLLRGTNLYYDDEAGELVVDLTVKNLGSFPHREPIGLTFIQLDPDEVTLVNPDNDIHGDGAAIVFQFANDDGVWTPDEASFPRTVRFGVTRGMSIAFVARLDLGPMIDGGAIAGRVWRDGNRNGVMEEDEPGIPGVAVYMAPFADDDEDSTVTREFFQTMTDREGRYVFGPLRAGGYVVSVAPSTIDFFPTTPTEIHVLLVEIDGEVSSYRHANFGGVPYDTPPPIGIGERVHVTGKFYDPDVFLTTFIERFLCPDDTIPGPLDVVPDPDCVGGRLRGPVTAVAPERGAFRVMNTWLVTEAMNIPPYIVVGMRLDVHVHRSAALNAPWVADSIANWEGPHEEIQGRVDAVDAWDGLLRILVLDTWIDVATVADPGQ